MIAHVTMKNFHTFSTTMVALCLAPIALAQPSTPGRPARTPTQSPAANPRPKSLIPQTYAAAQIRDGEVRFGAGCGFCHGKDAAGGESGPDLTRAQLVAQDNKGDKLIPVIRDGRPNAGMPAFKNLSDGD